MDQEKSERKSFSQNIQTEEQINYKSPTKSNQDQDRYKIRSQGFKILSNYSKTQEWLETIDAEFIYHLNLVFLWLTTFFFSTYIDTFKEFVIADIICQHCNYCCSLKGENENKIIHRKISIRKIELTKRNKRTVDLSKFPHPL